MPLKFYTYLWLRVDGTPYSVGKGSGCRAFTSHAHAVNCPDVSRIKLQYWPDEATALAYEMYYIDFYGRKDLGTGCLRNHTDGGEKQFGRIYGPVSQDTRRKLSEAGKGNKYSLGHVHTLQTKMKMSESHKGTKCPKVSEINKKRKGNYTEEHRRKIKFFTLMRKRNSSGIFLKKEAAYANS